MRQIRLREEGDSIITLLKQRFERYLDARIAHFIMGQQRPGGSLGEESAMRLAKDISAKIDACFDKIIRSHRESVTLRS